MSKKIVTYVLALAMIFSVFSNPALGYATTEAEDASAVTNTTANEEVTSDVTDTAVTENVESGAAEEIETTTPETKPEVKPAPVVKTVTGVKAKANSHKTIQVSWKKVSGATGYKVYRYNKAKGKYVLIVTTKKLVLKNTGLNANTSYKYKVRAYTKQDGKTYYGKYSKVVTCKTEKTDKDKISSLAYSKLDAQYRFGAKGPKRFDCSGFVYWVYENADVDTKVEVPETNSAGMYSALDDHMIGSSIKSIGKAKTGDIIFFKRGGRVSHVGIYYKDGKMIHAANPKKDVCIEKVSDYNKWGYKVVGIARVLG